MTNLRVFAIVAVIIGPLYLATAQYGPGMRQNVDTVAAAIPAQELARSGSLDVSAYQYPVQWFVPHDDGEYSERSPGIILFGAVFYLPFRTTLSDRLAVLGPSTLAAAVASTIAVALLAVGFNHLTASRAAVIGGLVFGVATSTWSISSAALWPHGPAQMWLATTIVAAAGDRNGIGIAGWVGAIVTRPITALAGVAVTAHRLLTRASKWWVPVVGTAFATAFLVSYHLAVFDQPTINIKAGDFTNSAAALSLSEYGGRLIGALLDPWTGVLVLCPLLVPCLIGIARIWKSSPAWVRSTAWGGAVYFVAHYIFNRNNPGLTFNYRYPLEAITLGAPVLFLGGLDWWRRGRYHRWILSSLVVFSVSVQLAEIMQVIITLRG